MDAISSNNSGLVDLLEHVNTLGSPELDSQAWHGSAFPPSESEGVEQSRLSEATCSDEQESPGEDLSQEHFVPSDYSEQVPYVEFLRDSSYDPDHAVRRSWTSLQHKPVQQFWETGFWSEVFGESEAATCSQTRLYRPQVNQQVITSDLDAAEVVRPPSKKTAYSIFQQVVKDVPVMTWKEEREAIWQRAIRRWLSMIETWNTEETIVKHLLSKQDFSTRAQILMDVFYNKSPSTLVKRCNSLARLVNHMNSEDVHFPCSEEYLYRYLCTERENGVKSSRLKALIEALTFCRHVLGLESLEGCLVSRRCAGAASSLSLGTVKQAPPLQVKHLLALHAALHESHELWDAACAGMALFCVYARARWTDAQHIEDLCFDLSDEGEVVFIEGSTGVHKTARALQLRHTFLPLTAPAVGVHPLNWGERWKKVRELLRIDNIKVYPPMPAPTAAGMATSRPLSTVEAGKWINMIIRKFSSCDETYTSHSLKATCLSYLAKAGCGFEDRLALGYHTNPLKMALTYSRDGASRPLRILMGVLGDIREGRFLPDSTRSGRFSSEVGTAFSSGTDDRVIHVKEEKKAVIDVDGEVVDVDSESDVPEQHPDEYFSTSSSSSSGEDAVVRPAQETIELKVDESVEIWKHKKFHTVHLSARGQNLSFLCGRKIGPQYSQAFGHQRFDVSRCRQCFHNRAVEQG